MFLYIQARRDRELSRLRDSSQLNAYVPIVSKFTMISEQ